MVPVGVRLSGPAREIQKRVEERHELVYNKQLRKDKFFQCLANARLYNMVADQGQMRQMRGFMPVFDRHLAAVTQRFHDEDPPEHGDVITLGAEEDARLTQGPGDSGADETNN